MKRIDVVSKRILAHLADDPAFDLDDLARRAQCTPEVAAARIEKLREDGILQGTTVRVDRTRLGRPHEMLVTGTPTATTDQAALASLCRAPGVTRVFTLASRSSVAFTVVGQDPETLRGLARAAADKAGLEDARCTLVINTLLDDPMQGVADLLPREAPAPGQVELTRA